MESIENAFLSQLETDQKTLKSLFSSAGAYDCPCRRKNMTNSQWQDYKNGYLQKVWKLLHERAFKYLDNPSSGLREKVFKFYNEDVKRIPCYTCRNHYTQYLRDNDLKKACDSRMSLCKFLIDLHNAVNKNTKKPEMSYEEVFKLYGYNYKTHSNINKYPIMSVVEKKTVKQQPVKQQPVKQESIKQESIKQEPVKKEVSLNKVDLKKHFEDLNRSLMEKFKSNKVEPKPVSNNRNSIIKNSMFGALKRGRW